MLMLNQNNEKNGSFDKNDQFPGSSKDMIFSLEVFFLTSFNVFRKQIQDGSGMSRRVIYH